MVVFLQCCICNAPAMPVNRTVYARWVALNMCIHGSVCVNAGRSLEEAVPAEQSRGLVMPTHRQLADISN